MKEITTNMIQELRERTGVGIGKCKEALVLAEGDLDKAVHHLRKIGLAAGAKKEGRETKEGQILAEENAKVLVFAEANVETDFVAQNERFKQFLHDVVSQALVSQPKSLEEFLNEPYAKDKSITIDQYRNLVIQALGENIQLRRLQVVHKHANSSYGIYSHMGGKIVVIVELEGATDQAAIAKDIAMHVAAESPDYLDEQEIPANVLAREEEIARSQVKDKPANIVDKIVAGKLQAFKAQVCLVDQKYVRDNALTVRQYVDASSKKVGKPLSVRCFWRWKVGQ